MTRLLRRSLAALALSAAAGVPALAQTPDSGIYQIALINIVPTAANGSTAHALITELIAAARKQPGLTQIKVTQQVGQPYNFTLIEEWKDQASLDAASASDGVKAFEQKLQPLLSGPAYQRTFKAFE